MANDKNTTTLPPEVQALIKAAQEQRDAVTERKTQIEAAMAATSVHVFISIEYAAPQPDGDGMIDDIPEVPPSIYQLLPDSQKSAIGSLLTAPLDDVLKGLDKAIKALEKAN